MWKVRVGTIYEYQPVGWDVFDPKTDLEAGERVRVINLPGAPPANTMCQCHVDRLDGSFAGMVATRSLKLLTKGE